MTPYELKANDLIKHFAQFINTPLELKDGVCALFDAEDQQSVVIEVPKQSSSVILHCTLLQLESNVSTDVLRAILLLNFEISAMQGCWLAIDEAGQICLCNMIDLEKTDHEHFKNTLMGFIEQVRDVRQFIYEILSSDTAIQ
ncbi:type III secretion system chaperone [Marinomonas balearica]|uniref:Tir chaperone family protein CesT n=1 Tax=Marinomonas balearica TaxID=491947 RepID=A0A4R6MC15_9GAMM|nr:type III secretion system chaperone [Marinomonas balearica]TDO98240.1 Tir chaperone family protein CesT [Marinomonas balearica]